MKFTLRDLFWLIFVAALAAGWFVHYRALSAEKQDERRKCAFTVAELTRMINDLSAKNHSLAQEALDQAVKCSGQQPDQ